MTLLAPAALWLSIVGLAVVALYLLKIKRRRQAVPALEFWQQLVGPSRVRSLFQQLKRWLSLALWLVIVACLILAVGNPILSFGKIKPQSIAIILDNSASMQTVEAESDGRTRLDLTREVVHELTTRRPVRDEWLLIEAGREPRVLQTWTYDRTSVRDAVDELSPRSGSADLAAARELAAQLLEGKERPAAVIISDGANGQVATLWKDDESAAYWPVGRSDDNLGITRLSVRPHRQQLQHYVYASVANASAQDVETQLVLELDGSTAAVEPIAIPAGGTWEKTITLEAPNGGVVRAWIDRDDSLKLDNEAFAIAAPIEPAAALLVAAPREAFFFEQALSAMTPLISPELCRTMSITDFDERGDDATLDYDLIIFNNCRPKELPAAGSFVFVNDWPDDVPARKVGALEQPELVLADREHPIVRHLNIGAVRLSRAREVDLTQRATVLARSTEGAPLVFLCEQPNRRMLCLAFDALESDLPFRNAFPMLLRNAVVYMVLDSDAWVRSQTRIGETIEPLRPLPDSVLQVTVARPGADDDAEQTVLVRGGSFLFADTDIAGPLRFTIGDETAYAAVNLTDETESRNAPTPAAAEPAERLALTDRLFGTVPWLALAIAATLLVCFEWLTFHYRWTE